MKHHCLNCEAVTQGNFCSNCGQKTDTHKITLQHFLQHDLLHGIWHFEKTILFTLKETFIRPGQAALDYINGKRIRYYNVFYLCLLVIGFNLLQSHFYERIHPSEAFDDDTPQVTRFFVDNLKFIILSIVPILGLNARWVFKKMKLNLAEHFILSGICLLGILLLSSFFIFFNFINALETPFIFVYFEMISFILMMLFPIWTYYNATKDHYTLKQFSWRMLVFYVCALLQVALILAGIILNLTGGKGQIYINL